MLSGIETRDVGMRDNGPLRLMVEGSGSRKASGGSSRTGITRNVYVCNCVSNCRCSIHFNICRMIYDSSSYEKKAKIDEYVYPDFDVVA